VATIVYEYTPIDGTVMSLKVMQSAAGFLETLSLLPEYNHSNAKQLGHDDGTGCTDEDSYGMCWCRTYARRVFIPESVGYEHGKLLTTN
jgi:hypothetical protein